MEECLEELCIHYDVCKRHNIDEEIDAITNCYNFQRKSDITSGGDVLEDLLKTINKDIDKHGNLEILKKYRHKILCGLVEGGK